MPSNTPDDAINRKSIVLGDFQANGSVAPEATSKPTMDQVRTTFVDS